jgi:hypothetical protein
MTNMVSLAAVRVAAWSLGSERSGFRILQQIKVNLSPWCLNHDQTLVKTEWLPPSIRYQPAAGGFHGLDHPHAVHGQDISG